MSIGGCELCNLVKVERGQILYMTKKLFILEDSNAYTASRHILVSPVEHIESICDLNRVKDIELINDMYKLACRFFEKENPGQKYRFGFHRPPQVSVYHLHLHGFVLPFQKKNYDEGLYGSMLISPEQVIAEIQGQEKLKSQPQF